MTFKENPQTCRRPLACGHPCGGVANENSCPPCLIEHCQGHQHYGDGHCPVCAEPWLTKPVIQVILLSYFHLFKAGFPIDHCCENEMKVKDNIVRNIHSFSVQSAHNCEIYTTIYISLSLSFSLSVDTCFIMTASNRC